MLEVDFKKFRQNLKNARLIAGLTGKELSERSGLKQQKRIGDIEEGRGVPSLAEINAICIILNQPMEEMLKLESTMVLKWNGKLVSKQYEE